MLSWWTIVRASGIGATAGLLALLLWPFERVYESLAWPLLALALLAGLCGLSILLITGADLIFHRRRGRRVRPLRVFDVVLGLALVVLSMVQIDEIAGQAAYLW